MLQLLRPQLTPPGHSWPFPPTVCRWAPGWSQIGYGVDDELFADAVDVGAAAEQVGIGDAEVVESLFDRAGEFWVFTCEIPAVCGLLHVACRAAVGWLGLRGWAGCLSGRSEHPARGADGGGDGGYMRRGIIAADRVV
jgi:hypothetical protein